MASVDFKIKGNIAKDLKKAGIRTVKKVDKALKKGAILVQGHATVNIQQGKRSGQINPRKKRGRRSARHEYPKTDTGFLVRSIRTKSLKFGEYQIGSNLEYAAILESKDPLHGGRPFLTRALKEKSNQIDSLLKKAVRSAFRKG